MFKSIRARIALGYIAVWALILILSATGAYVLLRHQLYKHLDDDLASGINVITLSLSHEIEEHEGKDAGEVAFRGIVGTMHQRSFPQQAILILDGTRLVAQKDGDAEVSLAELADLGRGNALLPSTEIMGLRVRTAQKAVTLPHIGTTYTVISCQPLRSVDLALGSLRLALLILVPLAVLLSAGGGYYLARESLRPVVVMADAVDRLNSRNLADSLPVLDSDDELGHLASTFNRLLSRLHVTIEQQRQFMADASHELRTPLSISLVTAQVALEQNRLGAEYRQALETVQTQAVRLSRMVQDMFLLAQSDSGVYEPRLQHCDLSEILLDAVKAGRALADHKGLSVRVPEFIEAPIHADSALLQQLVLILLDNAIKFSPPGSTIDLSLQQDDAGYRLRITDQGCGIPTEASERIFDRFFRVEQTRTQSTGGGAGLGLPIARWIAALHGGSVKLAQTSPKGTAFEVRLPCKRSS